MTNNITPAQLENMVRDCVEGGAKHQQAQEGDHFELDIPLCPFEAAGRNSSRGEEPGKCHFASRGRDARVYCTYAIQTMGREYRG